MAAASRPVSSALSKNAYPLAVASGVFWFGQSVERGGIRVYSLNGSPGRLSPDQISR